MRLVFSVPSFDALPIPHSFHHCYRLEVQGRAATKASLTGEHLIPYQELCTASPPFHPSSHLRERGKDQMHQAAELCVLLTWNGESKDSKDYSHLFSPSVTARTLLTEQRKCLQSNAIAENEVEQQRVGSGDGSAVSLGELCRFSG